MNIIPSDTKESIFDTIKSIEVLQQRAIIRPQNPPPGIAGFLFDIPEEDQIALRSDVTDHFLEDNTSVVDQIALKPEEVSVRGLVAELTSAQPNATRQAPLGPRPPLPDNPQLAPMNRSAAAILFSRASTLARILAPGTSQFSGIAKALVMSPQGVGQQIAADALIIANKVGYGAEASKALALGRFVASATRSAGRPNITRPRGNQNPIPPFTPLVAPALDIQPDSLYGMYVNNSVQQPMQTWQSNAFAYFYQLWKGRQLFTVETPWGTFTDMTIMSMTATQNDETRFRSSFSITFKKIRTAGNAVVTAGQLAGRVLQQSTPTTNNGAAATTPALTTAQKQSWLYRAFGP
jgi:hypothetical protein